MKLTLKPGLNFIFRLSHSDLVKIKIIVAEIFNHLPSNLSPVGLMFTIPYNMQHSVECRFADQFFKIFLQVLEVGFEREVAIRALKKHSGDSVKAIEDLVNSGGTVSTSDSDTGNKISFIDSRHSVN